MKPYPLSLAGLALLAAFWGGGSIHAQTISIDRKPDVIFVPTPQEMVDVMLKMADVKKGEMVYDLGCGDGRIVVTAARDFGARGIGVDIDPERIAESRENVRAAGVGDRVEIRHADLFEMDISDADVLALYLLPALNLKLRPRILDLRPGTRVVSNSFDMGDWRADQEEQDSSTGQQMYFWVVPAKVQGTWTVTLPDGKTGTLTLAQEFQEVSGTFEMDGKKQPLLEARLRGPALTFSYGEPSRRTQVSAKFADGRLNGTARLGESGAAQAWSAQRTE